MTRRTPEITKPFCHPDRRHKARGLCRACYDVAYYAGHGEERRAYDVAYYAAHREEHLARQDTYRYSVKLAAFNAYGGPKCVCCGETLIEGLTIDHINGDGAACRRETNHGGGLALYSWLKKNNYPPGFQVLCGTCNWAKGTGDHCPHQDVRTK